MKTIGYLFICSLIAVPFMASAVLLRPFGGRILTAPTPGVTCPAGKQPGSPFTVEPVMPMPPWLMVGDYHPLSISYQLVPGAWILGLYVPTPIPECATDSLPPVPVEGFRTFFHGTSVKAI